MKGEASKVRSGHLDFLDGIRGLAAFYVLLTHTYNLLFYAGVGSQGGWPHRAMVILKPLAFGRYAVDMFIVLSGFCLTLPVANGDGSLRGGFGGYLKRRATRILPTYYAALALSLVILAIRGAWLPTAASGDLHGSEAPAAGDLAAHLLLIHNLFVPWAHSINAPMWSVASEWQIYFFFPAVLLPVWRRLGLAASVAVAFTIGYALHGLVPGGLEAAAPWYLGLFALGMVAAAISSPRQSRWQRLLSRIPWGKVSLGLAVVLAAVGTLAGGWFRDNAWLIDPIFGLAAMSFILHCTGIVARGEAASVRHLAALRSRWVVGLGAFSYSLYLIHYPLVELAGAVLRALATPPGVQVAAAFGLGVPAITGLAYLFHLGFERPFMPGRPRSIREARVAAEVSPAP